ncbi:hypothetical protein GC173_05900 [bacterium]|nr:hypothetical protein [bacterium]
MKRSAILALGLALCAGWAQASEQWLYAADTSTGIIYGTPVESAGSQPLMPISGYATVTATRLVYLNADEVIFEPLGTGILAHLVLSTGTLTELGPYAGSPVMLRTHPDGNGVTLMSTVGSQIRLTTLTRAAAGADFDSDFVEFPVPASATGRAFLPAPDGDGWLLLDWGTALNAESQFVPISRVWKIGTDASATELTSFPLQYTRIEPAPNNRIALFATGSPAQLLEADGTPVSPLGLAPEIEQGTIETIALGETPRAAAVLNSATSGRGSFAVQEGATTDTLQILQPPFTLGDENITLQGAASLSQVDSNTWNYHDSVMGGIRQFDRSTRKAKQYFNLHRGTGPVMNEIRAITVGGDHQLYVLNRADLGMQILRVDPATGDRTEVCLITGRDLEPTIGNQLPNQFYLMERTAAISTATDSRLGIRVLHAIVDEGSVAFQEGPIADIAHSVADVSVSSGGVGSVLISSNNEGGYVHLDLSSARRANTSFEVPLQNWVLNTQSNTYDATYALPPEISQATSLAFRTTRSLGQSTIDLRDLGFTLPGESGMRHVVPSVIGQFAPSTSYGAAFSTKDLPIQEGDLQVSLQFFGSTAGILPLELKGEMLTNGMILIPSTVDQPRVAVIQPTIQRMSTLSPSPLLEGIDQTVQLSGADTEVAGLLRISSAVRVPGSTSDILAFSREGWRLLHIDAFTGEVTSLGSIEPDVINGRLLGNSPDPWVELTTGLMSTPASVTGWALD